LALWRFVGGWIAIPIGLVLWLVVALRFQRIIGDPVRPRWLVRLVDEPMFWHWGGALFALPLFVVALVAALVVGRSVLDAAVAAYGVGLFLSGWGLWVRRRWVEVRTIELPIPGLAPEFDGYRLAHLSDLHIGSYDPKSTGLRWAKMANALEPDLALVTGDLVTSGTKYYAAAADVVAALRAKDGTFATLGNHDQWDDKALTEELSSRGVRVLRNEWVDVEREGASLVIAGVDDRWTKKADLDKTLANRPPNTTTLLLAHYPDFFPEVLDRNVALTLSGHTHGGQFAVPFLARHLNLARVIGQRPRGLFREGQSVLCVNAGLGTTGPPIRLGIPPEIVLVVLRAV
jgi:predicted MPP superfamily phosphohydrolase